LLTAAREKLTVEKERADSLAGEHFKLSQELRGAFDQEAAERRATAAKLASSAALASDHVGLGAEKCGGGGQKIYLPIACSLPVAKTKSWGRWQRGNFCPALSLQRGRFGLGTFWNEDGVARGYISELTCSENYLKISKF
jgi:hypothetical protein